MRAVRAIHIVTIIALALSLPAQKVRGESSFEEITVGFEVPRLVQQDILVQYDGNSVFLPVCEIFRLLDINVGPDLEHTRIEGFLYTKDRKYELRPLENKAIVEKNEYSLSPGDFRFSGTEMYLQIDQFKRLFALEMTFDFSQLRVLLPLNQKFPAYQRLVRKQLRDKLRKTESALKNYKAIPLKREMFSGGVMDWTISANPVGGNGHYADVAMGSMLLGGDLSLSGTGNTQTGLQTDQLNYRWHYAFDANKFISQAELGKVNPGGLLSRSLKGGLLTNKPQLQRTYFQTINISGKLDPGWEIELYSDGKLIDFTRPNAAGEYSFAVSIDYGASDLQLKMYGPNGEIRTEERHVRVPYTLIPRGQFEYSVAGGEDGLSATTNWYSQGTAYFGITNQITAGVGADVPIVGVKNEKPLFDFEATGQITGNVISNASISPGYKYLFGVNYTTPNSLSADLTFTQYGNNPIRNLVGQQYNAALSLSAPLKIGNRYLGLRYYVARDKYKLFGSTSMNYGFTASVSRFYLNYLGRYKSTEYATHAVSSLATQILLSTDLFQFLRPQFRVDYDHTASAVSRVGVYVTRRLFRTGQLSIAYEHSPQYKTSGITLNVSFFTPVAYFATRSQYAEKKVTVTQMQRGSIRYDRAAGTVRMDRRSGTGYGSAVVRPFMDLNNDGVLDNNEEILKGLKARISGVGGRPVGRGNLFYYDGLRPYDTYTIQVDATSLDNPLLRPAYDNFKVAVNPNVVTTVDVPVVMAADISGTVERQTQSGSVGVGAMVLHVINLSNDIATDITTFSSGQYYYLGLIPGKYTAYLDAAQLAQYGYESEPKTREFEVKPSATGSSIEGISFVLKPSVK